MILDTMIRRILYKITRKLRKFDVSAQLQNEKN